MAWKNRMQKSGTPCSSCWVFLEHSRSIQLNVRNPATVRPPCGESAWRERDARAASCAGSQLFASSETRHQQQDEETFEMLHGQQPHEKPEWELPSSAPIPSDSWAKEMIITVLSHCFWSGLLYSNKELEQGGLEGYFERWHLNWRPRCHKGARGKRRTSGRGNSAQILRQRWIQQVKGQKEDQGGQSLTWWKWYVYQHVVGAFKILAIFSIIECLLMPGSLSGTEFHELRFWPWRNFALG